MGKNFRKTNLGISLVAKGTEKEQPIQPKTTLKVPIKKRIFAQVFVLGDITWIYDSLKRILQLALLLCQKNAKVQVSVTRDENLGKVIISSQSSKIPPNLTSQLFEKFYGSCKELPELSQTSGLEGFIAKNLLERMGAGAVVETSKNPPLIIFTVTLGLKAETVN